jgi:tRNA-Thr(GGU) m(6)t(6)A37 methyltransferase TsaA
LGWDVGRWITHGSAVEAIIKATDEEGEKSMVDDLQLKETVDEKRSLVYRAIGHVKNDFDKPAPPPEIRAVESWIIVDPSLTEGLKGLEPGQRIMVVFCFHLSQGFDLLQHPQGDRSRPRRGVFALRSPHRPNPIGVTVVDLVAVDGNVLRVRGLDAINGTPVLDLKPA